MFIHLLIIAMRKIQFIKGPFLELNLLVCRNASLVPYMSDTVEEQTALCFFIKNYDLDLIEMDN